MKIYNTYFSATNTTRTIIKAITKVIGAETLNYNVTSKKLEEEIRLSSDDVLLVGMPVYGGRIPTAAINSLQQFKGTHSRAILVAVYGNREFDDVFVEMQDILEANGFYIIAAGAFIAQHSVFPHTAQGRPDILDLQKIAEFGTCCKRLIQQGSMSESHNTNEGSNTENQEDTQDVKCAQNSRDEKASYQSISLPGHRPYKIPGNIPLKIIIDDTCTDCGTCVKTCPTSAISTDNPHITDYERCIHCGHCIYICHEHARHYGGLLYKVVGAAFGWKNRKRKEPQFFF